MKQKIEWYKEVLELEPGSRVFFPLAKLLAADGQTKEAINTLHLGLRGHPDHIEARLLLVELLHLHNDEPGLQREIENLGSIFSLYPGFWKAWSELLADTPAFHDAALALRFFSASLQGQSLSWAGIIEQGLQAILGQAMTMDAPFEMAGRTSGTMHETVRRGAEPAEGMPTVPHPLATAASSEAVGDEFSAEFNEEEESEEAFSLRTRSMAEVLAEQGDFSGAMDILQEIALSASEDEKNSIQTRIEELSSQMIAPELTEEQPEEKTAVQSAESTRLVSLLESLAQRLEDRAR